MSKGKLVLFGAGKIGRSFIGQDVGNMDSFDNFVSRYRLFDDLPTLEIEKTHLDFMYAMLPDAVKSAKKLYTQQLQGNLADEIEDKLKIHEDKLSKWLQDSERQLEIQFGLEEIGIAKSLKDRRKKDIEYVHEETRKFYDSYFQLDNDPYYRLLAVFYNA